MKNFDPVPLKENSWLRLKWEVGEYQRFESNQLLAILDAMPRAGTVVHSLYYEPADKPGKPPSAHKAPRPYYDFIEEYSASVARHASTYRIELAGAHTTAAVQLHREQDVWAGDFTLFVEKTDEGYFLNDAWFRYRYIGIPAEKKESDGDSHDAAYMNTKPEGAVDPYQFPDVRLMTSEPDLGYQRNRLEQAFFRQQLIDKGGRKCLVSGCDVIELLDAAHIVPYSEQGKSTAGNGILLRTDLHRLFDRKLMRIEPVEGKLKAVFNLDDEQVGSLGMTSRKDIDGSWCDQDYWKEIVKQFEAVTNRD